MPTEFNKTHPNVKYALCFLIFQNKDNEIKKSHRVAFTTNLAAKWLLIAIILLWPFWDFPNMLKDKNTWWYFPPL